MNLERNDARDLKKGAIVAFRLINSDKLATKCQGPWGIPGNFFFGIYKLKSIETGSEYDMQRKRLALINDVEESEII